MSFDVSAGSLEVSRDRGAGGVVPDVVDRPIVVAEAGELAFKLCAGGGRFDARFKADIATFAKIVKEAHIPAQD
jgi:hypothetical protein